VSGGGLSFTDNGDSATRIVVENTESATFLDPRRNCFRFAIGCRRIVYNRRAVLLIAKSGADGRFRLVPLSEYSRRIRHTPYETVRTHFDGVFSGLVQNRRFTFPRRTTAGSIYIYSASFSPNNPVRSPTTRAHYRRYCVCFGAKRTAPDRLEPARLSDPALLTSRGVGRS